MFLRVSSFKVSYDPKRVQQVFELVAAAQLISRFYIWGPNGQYVFVKVDSKEAYEVMNSKCSLLKKIEPFLSSSALNKLVTCLFVLMRTLVATKISRNYSLDEVWKFLQLIGSWNNMMISQLLKLGQ